MNEQLFMVIESWLNEKVEPVFRGRLLSIYMILVYFGIGGGQLLLNVNDVQGKSIFMLAAVLFAVCLIPISITRAVNPQPLRVPRYNMIKLFQLAPFSMVGSFTAVCGGDLGVAAFIYRKKLAGKVEDQVPFIPMPKTSPMVGILDPRGNPEDYSHDGKTTE